MANTTGNIYLIRNLLKPGFEFQCVCGCGYLMRVEALNGDILTAKSYDGKFIGNIMDTPLSVHVKKYMLRKTII